MYHYQLHPIDLCIESVLVLVVLSDNVNNRIKEAFVIVIN